MRALNCKQVILGTYFSFAFFRNRTTFSYRRRFALPSSKSLSRLTHNRRVPHPFALYAKSARGHLWLRTPGELRSPSETAIHVCHPSAANSFVQSVGPVRAARTSRDLLSPLVSARQGAPSFARALRIWRKGWALSAFPVRWDTLLFEDVVQLRVWSAFEARQATASAVPKPRESQGF
jgi:hypothetical protein